MAYKIETLLQTMPYQEYQYQLTEKYIAEQQWAKWNVFAEYIQQKLAHTNL